MNFTLVNRITGLVVFLFAAVLYAMTVQPTLSFWDCGEFIACAYTLGVPHPPGAPFFILVGKIFTMIPFASDIGLRMNYLSVISSAASVALLYLIATKVIKNWRGAPKTTFDMLLIVGGSVLAALSLAVSDTFWFNALEAEVYGFGTFLIALCIYLVMLWWEKADEPGSDKYLLMMAYVVGLSIGIHLLVVQCIFIAGLIFYFRRYEYSRKTLLIAIAVSAGAFFAVYPIMVKKVPALLQDFGIIFGVLMLAVLLGGIYYSVKNKSAVLNLLFMSLFLITLGYSTYATVLMRARIPDMPINENTPDDLESLVSYLNREQYGQQPLIWPRRYSQEPQHERTRQNYSSDMEFMFKYQINEMFNRYLFWQFIGRDGHNQGAKVDFNKFYAIPFLLGMLGLFYHFRKDWRLAFVFLAMFLMMGLVTALYQNQQDPQPRERDYFYVGAYFVFALWIGLGVVGIIEQIVSKLKDKSKMLAIGSAVLAVSLIVVPVNMLRQNYHSLDRSGNYFPYDYAYNLLQSAEKDAIIFTNGDNDTFPLWCLQAVYGIRQDVRIVNLSLAQTPWYILQLRNERPYGSLTVPMTYSDAQINELRPVQWDDNKVMAIPIPPEAYPDSIRNSGEQLPNQLQFVMPPSIRQRQGNQVITAVKTNDLLVLDIIRANNWERPIYFSVTVSNDNYIGLDNYLVTEGMLQRLVPFRATNEMGLAVNNEVMRECLFNIPTGPSPTPAYGFIYRGLDDKDIFYNQDATRMTETYRSLYLRLALSYAATPAGYDQAIETIAEMDRRIPRDVVPMDYRLMYETANLYKKMGMMDKYNEYAVDIEKEALNDIENNPGNFQSYFNPYRILIDIYESQGKYGEALAIIQRLGTLNPGDPSIQQKIQELQNKINGVPGSNNNIPGDTGSTTPGDTN